MQVTKNVFCVIERLGCRAQSAGQVAPSCAVVSSLMEVFSYVARSRPFVAGKCAVRLPYRRQVHLFQLKRHARSACPLSSNCLSFANMLPCYSSAVPESHQTRSERLQLALRITTFERIRTKNPSKLLIVFTSHLRSPRSLLPQPRRVRHQLIQPSLRPSLPSSLSLGEGCS